MQGQGVHPQVMRNQKKGLVINQESLAPAIKRFANFFEICSLLQELIRTNRLRRLFHKTP
jgi:hypothetical protein